MKVSKIVSIALSLFFSGLYAQTGSFDLAITHSGGNINGVARTHSFYVPASLDTSQPNKLFIAFHGFGPPNNQQDMRNNLIPIADSLGLVVISLQHYANAQLSTVDGLRNLELTDWAIEYSKQHYNLDTNYIYMTGFSAGGGTSIRYALNANTNYNIRGYIPFSPWHPGYTPAYSSMSTFPVTCACVGLNDVGYHDEVNDIYDGITNNSGDAKKIFVPSIGHTMTYPGLTATLYDCFSFFGIHAINTAPVLTPNDTVVNLVNGDSAKLCYSVFDINQPMDTLSFDMVNNTLSGAIITLDTLTNCISYKPDSTINSSDTIQVFVCDWKNECDTSQIVFNHTSTLSQGEQLAYHTSGVSIYPNPFDEGMRVRFYDNSKINAVELFTFSNQKIYGAVVNRHTAHLEIPRGLNSGVYILKITTDEQVLYRSVLKK